MVSDKRYRKKYSDKIGYINEKLEGNGTGVNIATDGEKDKIAAFGIAAYGKKQLALGIRYEGKSIQRYISTYKYKKGKYKHKKKLFTLSANKTFAAPQCMEYYKKRFYIIRFNDLEGNNNCVEIYNKKGKKIKTYTIRDPKVKVEVKNPKNSKKTKITKVDFKSKNWEIESFSHYNGKTFYYTQLKPNTKGNKQAYLYKIKLK